MNSLVTLEAVYRHGSFTRAAEELALSQASVSRQIRDLEKSLNTRLFERRRYDVAPTEAGERFCEEIVGSLFEIAQASERIRSPFDETTFTLLSDLALASSTIAPIIGEFGRHHPEVNVRVLATSEPIEDVLEGFDLGLQSGRWATDKFEILPVADDQIFPVCSPAFAKQLLKNFHPEDLLSVPLLHLNQPGRKWCSWRDFLRAFDLELPEKHVSLEFSSYDVCLEVAAAGEGVALGWARTAQMQLDSGKLARIPGMLLPQLGDVCFYSRRGAAKHPLVEKFIRHFAENTDILRSD